MALERVPSDIRKEGGVARMANIAKMEEISCAMTYAVGSIPAERKLLMSGRTAPSARRAIEVPAGFHDFAS